MNVALGLGIGSEPPDNRMKMDPRKNRMKMEGY
jgi:hypothetical protein